MERDEAIDPDTAPMNQIRALPFLMGAIFAACNPDVCESYRKYQWEQAVRRLNNMEQL